MAKRYVWHEGDRYQGIWRWLAWRLPRPLIYWAAIRLISRATVEEYSDTIVPDLGAMEALRRWEKT